MVLKILMVSAYPPIRDGVAAHAVQEAAALRKQGHEVELLSPYPSAAHHHLDLASRRGPLALAKRVRRFDSVVIQFHPDFFYPVNSSPWGQAIITAGLIGVMLAARRTEVRVHEIDYSKGRGPGLNALLFRLMWKLPDRVIVHTQVQKEEFHRAFRRKQSRIEVVFVAADFVRRTWLDRAAARSRLGIPEDSFMFLALGFIQPHKGFDRAIRAFQGLGGHQVRLDIVGSVRVETPEFLLYLKELEGLAASTRGVTIHNRYLSDEEFDLWIVASDILVLPYKYIWISGVMERARMYSRPVIATRVGGLAEQAPEGTILVEDDEQLAESMRAALARAGVGVNEAKAWTFDAPVDREAVAAEIRARAAGQRGVDSLPRRSEVSAVTAPLRSLKALGLPQPISHRPWVSWLKRMVMRLTAWELAPVVAQVNELRNANIEVAEALVDQTKAQSDEESISQRTRGL